MGNLCYKSTGVSEAEVVNILPPTNNGGDAKKPVETKVHPKIEPQKESIVGTEAKGNATDKNTKPSAKGTIAKAKAKAKEKRKSMELQKVDPIDDVDENEDDDKISTVIVQTASQEMLEELPMAKADFTDFSYSCRSTLKTIMEGLNIHLSMTLPIEFALRCMCNLAISFCTIVIV